MCRARKALHVCSPSPALGHPAQGQLRAAAVHRREEQKTALQVAGLLPARDSPPVPAAPPEQKHQLLARSQGRPAHPGSGAAKPQRHQKPLVLPKGHFPYKEETVGLRGGAPLPGGVPTAVLTYAGEGRGAGKCSGSTGRGGRLPSRVR